MPLTDIQRRKVEDFVASHTEVKVTKAYIPSYARGWHVFITGKIDAGFPDEGYDDSELIARFDHEAAASERMNEAQLYCRDRVERAEAHDQSDAEGYRLFAKRLARHLGEV